MIKVGQLRNYDGNILVVTKIFYDAVSGKYNADVIYSDGFTDTYSTEFIEKHFKLVTTYQTWQEAVNSKGFKE